MQYLLDIAAILIIPLVPALLLYAILPSETSVSGPFKGLNLNLKGSFAGYFLLVLIAGAYLWNNNNLSEEIKKLNDDLAKERQLPKHEIWTVSGRFKFSSTVNYNRNHPTEFVKVFYFPTASEPGLLESGNIMRFTANVPVSRSSDGSIDSIVQSLRFDATDHFPAGFEFLKGVKADLAGGAASEVRKFTRIETSIEITDPVEFEFDPNQRISR